MASKIDEDTMPDALVMNADFWSNVAKGLPLPDLRSLQAVFLCVKDDGAQDVRTQLELSRASLIGQEIQPRLRRLQQNLMDASFFHHERGVFEAITGFRALLAEGVLGPKHLCPAVADLVATALEPTPGAWKEEHTQVLRDITPEDHLERRRPCTSSYGPLTRAVDLLVSEPMERLQLDASWLFATLYGMREGITYLCVLLLFLGRHSAESFDNIFEMFRVTTTPTGPHFSRIQRDFRKVNRSMGRNSKRDLLDMLPSRKLLPRLREVVPNSRTLADMIRNGPSSVDQWEEKQLAEITASLSARCAYLRKFVVVAHKTYEKDERRGFS
eukprot:jgi/Mesvir1/20146/Mv13385-RA.1